MVNLFRRHVPEQAQVVGLDGLLAALSAELAKATMVVQNEPWGFAARQPIEDLLRCFVVAGKLNRFRLALAAKDDRPCLGLHPLMPSKDETTYGQEKRQIPSKRFSLPKQDGTVVKRAEGGLAFNAAQGVEPKGNILVFEDRA